MQCSIACVRPSATSCRLKEPSHCEPTLHLGNRLDALHDVVLLCNLACQLCKATITVRKGHKLDLRQPAVAPCEPGALWHASAVRCTPAVHCGRQRGGNVHGVCVRVHKLWQRGAREDAYARGDRGAGEAHRYEERCGDLRQQRFTGVRTQPGQLCERCEAAVHSMDAVQARLSARHRHAHLVRPCTRPQRNVNTSRAPMTRSSRRPSALAIWCTRLLLAVHSLSRIAIVQHAAFDHREQRINVRTAHEKGCRDSGPVRQQHAHRQPWQLRTHALLA